MPLPLQDRLDARTDKTSTVITSPHVETPCWTWTGARSHNGYGTLRLDGKLQKTHRLAWEVAYGHPGELCVLHRCDNRLCVRPDHLRAASQIANVEDMVMKGRQARGPKARTWQRARGEASGASKLTEADVREIRERFAAGEWKNAIAASKGVKKGCIRAIVHRKTWRHIE